MLPASLQPHGPHHVAYIVHKQNHTYIYKSHNICLKQKCKDKCDNTQDQAYHICAQKCLICFLSLLIFHILLLTPSFLPRHLPISFQFVFSRLLYSEKTHDMCFFTYLYAFTHSFLSDSCQSASSLCFLACSPLKKHTTCVFSLAYMLLHTVFSPSLTNQLPGWVFTLVFLFLHPQRGFLRLQTPAHTNLIKCI